MSRRIQLFAKIFPKRYERTLTRQEVDNVMFWVDEMFLAQIYLIATENYYFMDRESLESLSRRKGLFFTFWWFPSFLTYRSSVDDFIDAYIQLLKLPEYRSHASELEANINNGIQIR